MRTNSSSSFGSAYMEEAVSPTSSTTGSMEIDREFFSKLRCYGKFFTIKLLQILVQSRTNEKYDQPCIAKKSPLWFNLSVDELGEVSAQLKSLPKYPPDIDSMCIDFFLYTADSQTLPLESWAFHINKGETASTGTTGKSEMSELYHQLATLLKSTACAARMTPMHRYYVKKQSADTFVILYKVQSGFTNINLGKEAKTKVIGCFPSSIGAFTLTLSYRTRMEIEERLAQSYAGLSPDGGPEVLDSFQKIAVGSDSSANTPEYENVANSPRSMDAISHFSVSPPSGQSPLIHAPFIRGFSQRSGRSRASSLASEPEVDPSPKDRLIVSHSMPVIPKNLPFANLLTLSYTGALLPLHSVPEEKEKHSEEETEANEEEEAPKDKSEVVQQEQEQKPDEAQMEHSQQTVVDDVMNETMKPPSEERVESEDEDSFVKIPAYGPGDYNESQGLNELIATCKTPAKLESFGGNDLSYVLSQLDNFSLTQGSFDQFISSIRIMGSQDGDA